MRAAVHSSPLVSSLSDKPPLLSKDTAGTGSVSTFTPSEDRRVIILTLSLRTEGADKRPLEPKVREGGALVLARVEVDLGACDVDVVDVVDLFAGTAKAHLSMCFRFLGDSALRVQ